MVVSLTKQDVEASEMCDHEFLNKVSNTFALRHTLKIKRDKIAELQASLNTTTEEVEELEITVRNMTTEIEELKTTCEGPFAMDCCQVYRVVQHLVSIQFVM